MKDLSTLSDQQLREFFSSFDNVVSDIDGVLWNVLAPVAGANEAIAAIKRINKKIIFVSNNTTRTIDTLHQLLTTAGFNIDKESLVTPTLAIISYLHKLNLDDKKVFVLSMDALKQSLVEAGFKLAENAPDHIEDVPEYVRESIKKEPKVAVVIADIDLNLNYINLQRAVTYLEDPEVQFLCGALDRRFPISEDRSLVGPGVFIKLLESVTQRKGTQMAKLSLCLSEFVAEKFGFTDPKRVLIIGDSVLEDMHWGTKLGYKKLLVLSGLTKSSSLEDWIFPDEYKPDYYVESLKVVHELIVQIYGNEY